MIFSSFKEIIPFCFHLQETIQREREKRKGKEETQFNANLRLHACLVKVKSFFFCFSCQVKEWEEGRKWIWFNKHNKLIHCSLLLKYIYMATSYKLSILCGRTQAAASSGRSFLVFIFKIIMMEAAFEEFQSRCFIMSIRLMKFHYELFPLTLNVCCSESIVLNQNLIILCSSLSSQQHQRMNFYRWEIYLFIFVVSSIYILFYSFRAWVNSILIPFSWAHLLLSLSSTSSHVSFSLFRRRLRHLLSLTHAHMTLHPYLYSSFSSQQECISECQLLRNHLFI